MYRHAPDPHLVTPGEGFRDLLVGRASPEEVLSELGTDAKVSSYESGQIFAISYDYADDDDYAPSRPVQEGRPAGFRFEFGMLQAIQVGVYQTKLRTQGDIRIGDTKPRIVEVFGEASRVFDAGDDRLALVYPALGIELTVSDDALVGFVIFRARR